MYLQCSEAVGFPLPNRVSLSQNYIENSTKRNTFAFISVTYHAEQHTCCSFSLHDFITQLIIDFNGNFFHFFHYSTLIQLVAKERKTEVQAEWEVSACNYLFTFILAEWS